MRWATASVVTTPEPIVPRILSNHSQTHSSLFSLFFPSLYKYTKICRGLHSILVSIYLSLEGSLCDENRVWNKKT